jgi:outer membrane protein assembly factor BamB
MALLLLPSTALTKRRAPKPVPPLVHEGVEYRAPHALMGFVEAIDTASGRQLWETRVYYVMIDPLGERDVQDVFITSLQVENGRLLVSNEAGKTFTLDLKTGQVKGSIWYSVPFLCITSAVVLAAFLVWRRLVSRRQPSGIVE